MNAAAPVAEIAATSIGGVSKTPQLTLEVMQVEPADGAQFRAALERHMGASSGAGQGFGEGQKGSLGEKIMTRTTDLASELKHDQQYVSKALEQATRSADSMQLMKAMMALNDYQIRVQLISKTVSKATSSVEQLTKLQ
jgi:hypothetical protein